MFPVDLRNIFTKAGCFHAVLHVLIGGLLKADQNGLEGRGCMLNVQLEGFKCNRTSCDILLMQ